ncbi:MAG: DUF2333 family protein [Desulfobacterales bacterium]|nr:DUF2333 family protein [Desulfobacterales bacterium]
MENAKNSEKKDGEKKEYKWFMMKRVLIGLLIAAALLWGGSFIFEIFEEPVGELASTGLESQTAPHSPDVADVTDPSHEESAVSDHGTEKGEPAGADAHEEAPATAHDAAADLEDETHQPPAGSMKAFLADVEEDHPTEPADDHAEKPVEEKHADAEKEPEPADHPEEPAEDHPAEDHPAETTGEKRADAGPEHEPADHPEAPADDHGEKAAEVKHEEKPHAPRAKGALFVEAAIKPLDYELHERFWGWRINDIVRVTDNVNSYQLGVLEVTRRTVVILTERLSRIGSTASFDEDLEHAMNWFMIKPENYWFPSPESKYEDGLNDMRAYLEKLEKGEARFYTRADNLIPLLLAYKDLLGSCDENLVKAKEKSGLDVSFFKSDNYFFYAQGVAAAMVTILEAVHHEFHDVLESRNAVEALHHAIESCHHATTMDPWIILDSDLSSIFANHRANMAAPISHAKFYLEVMIKALST